MVLEARDRVRLDGFKKEDRTLRDFSALSFGTLSSLVTELTNNFIYKSAHLVSLSANLCAFFVKHFHIFQMPVEDLEFSIHFYTAYSIDRNFFDFGGGKRKEKNFFLLSQAMLFSLLWLHLQAGRNHNVTTCSFLCCPIQVHSELSACFEPFSVPLDIEFVAINRIQGEPQRGEPHASNNV